MKRRAETGAVLHPRSGEPGTHPGLLEWDPVGVAKRRRVANRLNAPHPASFRVKPSTFRLASAPIFGASLCQVVRAFPHWNEEGGAQRRGGVGSSRQGLYAIRLGLRPSHLPRYGEGPTRHFRLGQRCVPTLACSEKGTPLKLNSDGPRRLSVASASPFAETRPKLGSTAATSACGPLPRSPPRRSSRRRRAG